MNERKYRRYNFVLKLLKRDAIKSATNSNFWIFGVVSQYWSIISLHLLNQIMHCEMLGFIT